MNLFCSDCKSLLIFENGKKICKKCTSPKKKDKKQDKTKRLEKLENMVVKFEDKNIDSKNKYELIFIESLSDLIYLKKNPNNYVLCKCQPSDEEMSKLSYISLRFFMRKGGYIPSNKTAYVPNVPCERNCEQLCPFILSEDIGSVINKIDKYKTQFKRVLAHLDKELPEE
jgi:hypothetical protein